ncbi:hypothetical protein K474DRAFT_1517240 [Panus rudis PR-1116 ss-1]|nr:hypothetical protein K474DRAFT_1517240 [Panus rudis PR-1116 ss-1]
MRLSILSTLVVVAATFSPMLVNGAPTTGVPRNGVSRQFARRQDDSYDYAAGLNGENDGTYYDEQPTSDDADVPDPNAYDTSAGPDSTDEDNSDFATSPADNNPDGYPQYDCTPGDGDLEGYPATNPGPSDEDFTETEGIDPSSMIGSGASSELVPVKRDSESRGGSSTIHSGSIMPNNGEIHDRPAELSPSTNRGNFRTPSGILGLGIGRRQIHVERDDSGQGGSSTIHSGSIMPNNGVIHDRPAELSPSTDRSTDRSNLRTLSGGGGILGLGIGRRDAQLV